MINFVFMLTHNDRTVPDAADVLNSLAGSGLRHVGFKDVGVSPAVIRALTDQAHELGMTVMLEVVSTSREDELASLHAAVAGGVDWVLGGTHGDAGAALFRGTGLRYCPFPGTVVGHPSVLRGTIEEIAADAARLTALDGVHGVDLLTYRHADADPHGLTAAVTAASGGPVIVAGSITGAAQIALMSRAGAWGFTIGGAIFEGKLPGGPSIADQVRTVLDFSAMVDA
ncbi:4-hydroxythreonine-4-phosphate dehydrogenase [Acrocarpospora macrocephala]|uniref:4-hydroxythreonine-4-phosphate dehydrogenase n=1 Tax=Acrocarpospora macrocephala TaxID=150177 RepID=A0A5M3WXR4_9ACTN|nr:1-(5-phosphoribosyl)-5-((5-phosphoribosylamino)methylideneamino)imidazole-4-carboxamide isomerase [Acrocarpospora macrocephala]GES14267.1 4-hydroxythreonine-4-phosphate dehydrogenase [Acrocarpospora macrocephala]